MRSAIFACHSVHVVGSQTRNSCAPFDVYDYEGPLHGTPVRTCWECLSAMCRVAVATRLCTVLAGLLTPAIFLTVHSECWCVSAPLAASLSANSFPTNIQEWLVLRPQRPLACVALDFEDKDRRRVVLNSRHRLRHGVRPGP